MSTFKPFRSEVPQADLDDLRDRLARTRWPDEPPGGGWSYGVSKRYLVELVERWRVGYDWRQHQARLPLAVYRFRQGTARPELHVV